MKNPMEGLMLAAALVKKLTKPPQMTECKTPEDAGKALAAMKRISEEPSAEMVFARLEMEGRPVYITVAGVGGSITEVKQLLG